MVVRTVDVSCNSVIKKQLLPRIQYISAAILNPTSDIHWVKFLLLLGHQRCARLVEAGNLSKAYNLHTSSPVTSLLSSQETILLLRDFHPLHTASFQPHELATFVTLYVL